jgi:nitrite reductase/ring-hydroxylating ferredoxin subunit
MTVQPDLPVRVLADAGRLGEGEGARFTLRIGGIERDGFVIRHHGRLYGYLNACRHQSRPLDFGDARFLDPAAGVLVCCHHGARYRPETGDCLDGPCAGGRLSPLPLEERNGELWCGAAPATPRG